MITQQIFTVSRGRIPTENREGCPAIVVAVWLEDGVAICRTEHMAAEVACASPDGDWRERADLHNLPVCAVFGGDDTQWPLFWWRGERLPSTGRLVPMPSWPQDSGMRGDLSHIPTATVAAIRAADGWYWG